MGLDEGLFVGRDVLLDWDGLVAGRRAKVLKRGLELVEIEVQTLRDERQVGIEVLVLFANEEAGDRGIVIDEQAAIAVQQLAARSHDGLLADAVFLGQLLEVRSAEDLQPPQAGAEGQHDQQNAVLHRRRFEGGELFAAIEVLRKHDAAAFSILPFLLRFLKKIQTAGAKAPNSFFRLFRHD